MPQRVRDLSYSYNISVLASIAALSQVEIVTKCAGEVVGRSYRLDCKGDIVTETGTPTVTGSLSAQLPLEGHFKPPFLNGD